MKLFRRAEPKSTHPHAKALEHLANAHRALMKENAAEGRQHIGRAFQAVSVGLPNQAPAQKQVAAPPVPAPGNDIGTTPKSLNGLRAASTRMNGGTHA